jgi:hypothetical protein
MLVPVPILRQVARQLRRQEEIHPSVLLWVLLLSVRAQSQARARAWLLLLAPSRRVLRRFLPLLVRQAGRQQPRLVCRLERLRVQQALPWA